MGRNEQDNSQPDHDFPQVRTLPLDFVIVSDVEFTVNTHKRGTGPCRRL